MKEKLKNKILFLFELTYFLYLDCIYRITANDHNDYDDELKEKNSSYFIFIQL